MIHRYLEHFKALAETNSMHEAAEQLHISQPALSRSLKILEDLLQTTLFVRRNNGIEINEYGKILHQQVCAMAYDFENAVEEMEYLKKIQSRKLRLGAGMVWQYSIFPEVFKQYSRDYSDVKVSIISGYAQMLYEQFLEGGLDIVFCDLEPLYHVEGIICEHVIDVVFTYYAACNHPVLDLDDPAEKDLEEYDFALYSHSNRIDVEQTGFKQISPRLQRKIKFTSASMYSLMTVVGESRYITSMPVSMASIAAKAGLKEINVSFRRNSFPSGVVYRESSLRREYINDFLRITRGVSGKL